MIVGLIFIELNYNRLSIMARINSRSEKMNGRVTFRATERDLVDLKLAAQSKGLDVSGLIRMLLIQKRSFQHSVKTYLNKTMGIETFDKTLDYLAFTKENISDKVGKTLTSAQCAWQK